MANDNYSNFTRTRPNKSFYQPENHRKESSRRSKGSESERNRLATVFSFKVWTLEFFERQKKTRPRKLTDTNLGQPGLKN